MKTCFKELLPLFITPCITALAAGHLSAQTFNAVCDLPPYNDGPPELLLSSNTVYWVSPGNWLAFFGHVGTVCKLNPDGSSTWGLYNFNYDTGEGYMPRSGLVLSGNTFYGTAVWGGLGTGFGNGTVFSLNIDGTGHQDIYQFSGAADGATPYGGLVITSNTLYGTATYGGSSGNGTVFKLNTDGTGFTTLYTFSTLQTPTAGTAATNNDGAHPKAQLVLSGTTLYGTATGGGTGGAGTVFALHTDGSGFTNLHSFDPVDSATGTNHDGAGPAAPLILSGNTVFGTAPGGGASSNGTVFKFNIDSTGFSVLHTFAPTTGNAAPLTNSDGSGPGTRLYLSADTLYGTAYGGGTSGYGTVFAVKTDGTGFRLLETFLGVGAYPNPGDGDYPSSGLLRVGNALYGCVNTGPAGNGEGLMYRLAFATPPLSITRSGGNVLLSWPVSYAGFDYAACTLESATSLASPLWTTNSSPPAVVNGINTVTVPIAGTQQFFRLMP